MIPIQRTGSTLDRAGPPTANEVGDPRSFTDPNAPTSAVIKSVLSSSHPVMDPAGYRLADDVILLVVHDGSGRLIDLAGNISAVTESGTAMLELALRHGADAACQTLGSRYQTDGRLIRMDMDALFRGLQKQHVLVAVAANRNRKSLPRILSWVIGPLVFLCARRPSRCMPMKACLLITLAFAATRLFGWTNTIRVWDHVSSRLMANRGYAGGEADILDAIDSVVTRAISRHPLTVGCKERALCCWVLARASGIPASVLLGIDLFPFGLHCWCEYRSHILADRYEGRCDRYTPVLVYG
jgi:transglutaminase superfamily protein